MKKALLGTVVLLVVVLCGLRAFGVYMPWQTGVTWLSTPATYEESVKSELNDQEFIIKFADKNEELKLCDFGEPIVTISSQNVAAWLAGSEITKTVTWQLDSNALQSKIAEYYVEPTNAKIKVDETNSVVLIPQEDAYSFDIAAVTDAVINNCVDGVYELDITNYKVPSTKTTSDLQAKYDKVSWINDFQIVYSDGTVFNKDYLSKFVKKGKFSITEDDLSDFLDTLSTSYNTADGTLDFTTHDGSKKSVKYNTYGLHLYRDKETAFIMQAIEDKASCTDRTPETYGYDNFGDTYIEVSEDDQHLWVYVDGKLKMETNIVTGTKNVHDTPTGVFYISECIPGKNLRGADYVTWVNRWMRLTNSGVGLHDAYWRSNFGGTIYKSSGSHGCINLPKSFAYELYEIAYVGMPVVVY